METMLLIVCCVIAVGGSLVMIIDWLMNLKVEVVVDNTDYQLYEDLKSLEIENELLKDRISRMNAALNGTCDDDILDF